MTDNKHHIISLKVYIIVFFTLLLMTALTIITAQYDFGSLNIILALLIASFKSSLVLLFFMHLYYDNKTNLLFFLGSVLFLIIFIGFTFFDVGFRGGIYKVEDKTPDTIIYKEGSIKGSHKGQ